MAHKLLINPDFIKRWIENLEKKLQKSWEITGICLIWLRKIRKPFSKMKTYRGKYL